MQDFCELQKSYRRTDIKCLSLKYKSNINKKKKISGNLFVTISASARGICTRKCEQILCLGTFILFKSTNEIKLIFFFHMKLQNFEFKNYLNHYWKRSDHFLGILKFLHTVSVSSSDSLVIGFKKINSINTSNNWFNNWSHL
jgi:hypothetical protein